MASLIALVGRALTALLAGLAAKVVGSFVKGLMPLRAGRAGFLTTTNFANPGSTKTPFFFSSLWPTSTIASSTAFTSLRDAPSPTLSTTARSRPLLVSCFEAAFAFGFAIRKNLLVRAKDRQRAPLGLEIQPQTAIASASRRGARALSRTLSLAFRSLAGAPSAACGALRAARARQRESPKTAEFPGYRG